MGKTGFFTPPAWPHKWNYYKIDGHLTADHCKNCGLTVETYYFANDEMRKRLDDACIKKAEKDASIRERNKKYRDEKKASQLELL